MTPSPPPQSNITISWNVAQVKMLLLWTKKKDENDPILYLFIYLSIFLKTCFIYWLIESFHGIIPSPEWLFQAEMVLFEVLVMPNNLVVHWNFSTSRKLVKFQFCFWPPPPFPSFYWIFGMVIFVHGPLMASLHIHSTMIATRAAPQIWGVTYRTHTTVTIVMPCLALVNTKLSPWTYTRTFELQVYITVFSATV